MNILEKIVAHKRKEVTEQKEKISTTEMEKYIAGLGPCRLFKDAIARPGEVTLIAEIKRASPSKGVIRSSLNPAGVAGIYSRAGAAAISVLTDYQFFGGKPETLSLVKKQSNLPVLRKDFIIDPYQIYESRYIGSDAILLITAILTDKELRQFQIIANDLGLSCLVEVHTRDELDCALESGAKIIGINNRNLHTFETDLSATFYLRPYITDPGIVVVSESGISTREQIIALKEHKVNSALVGESLMCSENIEEKVKELLGR